jgi:hypothetical protein
MMPSDALETLYQVNEYLHWALIRLGPQQKHCSTIRAQDFFDILNQLLRASDCLRGLPPGSALPSALEKEALTYRGNLEKLENFLPDIHARLLAEKVRLETAQTHLAGAAAWAQASKKTL